MKASAAWRRWKSTRDPEAGATLARRYDYLADAPAALQEFDGRPGSFADYARRRALGPPVEIGPIVASAVLSPDLAPCYPVLARRFTPAPAPAAPELDRAVVPQETVAAEAPGVGDDGEVGDVAEAGASVEEADTEPVAPVRVHLLAPAYRLPSPAAPGRPPASGPRRPATAPHQVAEVKLLRFWHDALSVVHRICRPDDDREVGSLRLAVEDGCLKLFGRDASRAHWSCIPARTQGTAQIAMDRLDIRMGEWGQAGRLVIFADWLLFEPASGGRFWAPVIPAAMPAVPDDTGSAGVVLHRDDLLDALREALGGSLLCADLPAEIRLQHEGDGLVITAEGRRTVRLPISDGRGDLDVRLRPRLLTDALGCCPCDEVTVESLGRWQPLRLRSGWLTSVMATRCEESLL